jgi:hypothetical protein
LYAGQIHYLSARSSNGKPLEMTARTPSSDAITIQFHRQTSTIEAPYLHWCRSRIDRLVAESNEKAAVALSVESNLICRLTAFVAWDESEKVAVATHQLMQPGMELERKAMLCAAAPGRFKGMAKNASRSGFTSRLFTTETGAGDIQELAEEMPAMDRSAPDEVTLRREFSDLCHRFGVLDWKLLVKAIFDWIAEAKGEEGSRRIESVVRLFEAMKAVAQQANIVRSNQKEIGNKIHELMQSFVKTFSAKHQP